MVGQYDRKISVTLTFIHTHKANDFINICFGQDVHYRNHSKPPPMLYLFTLSLTVQSGLSSLPYAINSLEDSPIQHTEGRLELAIPCDS